jgi:hypothetical protein
MQMQIQLPDYESLISVLSAAGQDQRLLSLVEGLMQRQIEMDGESAESNKALQHSSQMWQSLYQALQYGVMFVERRRSVPDFKMQSQVHSNSKSFVGHQRKSLSQIQNIFRSKLSSIDSNLLHRHSIENWNNQLPQNYEMLKESPKSGLSSTTRDAAGDAAENCSSSSPVSAQQTAQQQRRRSFVDPHSYENKGK